MLNLAVKSKKCRCLKSILIVLICLAMTMLLILLQNSITTNKKQLEELPCSVPVYAYLGNQDGSRNVGLQIRAQTVDDILETGKVRDLKYTSQLAANIAPETPTAKDIPVLSVSGVNDFSALRTLNADFIQFYEGYSEEDFFEDEAVCIVNENYVLNNQSADSAELSLYYLYYPGDGDELTYRYLANETIQIIGCFTVGAEDSLPDFIVPVKYLEMIHRENKVEFMLDSAGFHIDDPLKLNEFKREMKDIGLLPVNTQAEFSISGKTLIIDDKPFIKTAESIQSNLKTLESVAPVVLFVVLLIGFFISHLLIQSRTKEVAIYRSIGMKKSRCLSLLLMEHTVLYLSGVGMAAILALILNFELNIETVLYVVVSQELGLIVSVLLLMRKKLADVLVRAD